MPFPSKIRILGRRKYTPGDVIASVQELYEAGMHRWIFPNGSGRVTHPSWIKNLPLSVVGRMVATKQMRWAIRDVNAPYIFTALWWEHKICPRESVWDVRCLEDSRIEIKPARTEKVIIQRCRAAVPAGSNIEVRFHSYAPIP